MNTTTTANTSALLVIVLQDGSRLTQEIVNSGKRGWLRDGLARVGSNLMINPDRVAASVLIDGTDFYQYTANETREVLGL